MKRLYTLLYTILSIFTGVQVLYAQFPTRYEVVTYTPSEYDSHNQNWDVEKDEDGYLYFANGDGILQFDGHTWRLINTEKKATVLSLSKHESKNIIFTGGINEFGYISPNKYGKMEFTSLSTRLVDSLQNFNNVWNTAFYNDDAYFFAGNRLFIYNSEDTIIHHNAKGAFDEYIIFNDKLIFIDFRHGLCTVQDGHLAYLPNTAENLEDVSITALLPYNENEILIIGSYESYIYSLEDYSFREYEHELTKIEAEKRILKTRMLKNGNYAMGIKQFGLVILSKEGKIVDYYSPKEGYFASGITNIYEDENGVIWCTTHKGIGRVNANSPFTVLKEERDFSGIINTVTKHENNLYLGTTEGVYQIENRSFFSDDSHVKKVENFHSQCFDILSIGQKMIVAATNGNLVIRNNEVLKHFIGYSRAFIKIDGYENIIANGGRETFSIKQFNPKTNDLVDLLHVDDFPDEVLRIEEEITDNDSIVLWAGLFSQGVARISISPDFKSYHVDKFSTDHGFEEGYVNPFKFDDKIYFVTKFQEVYIRENGSFKPDSIITKLMGRLSPYLISKDRKENYYLEVPSSLNFARKTANGYKVDSLIFKNLGYGYLNSIFIDKENIAWIGFEGALLRFNPEFKSQKEDSFKALLTSITVSDSIKYSQNKKLQLQYENNDIVFEFTAPYFDKNEDIQFAFKLDGYNEVYSEWKKERKAFYTNLYEGTYTFKVKAKNHRGIESDTASFTFTINPPWYRTAWAFGSYGVLTIGLIILIIYLNSRRLKASNLKLQRIIEEKTSEIVNQRDALQDQNIEIEEQKKNLEEKNKNILDSITYAKRIQRALLQAEDQVSNHLPEHFILFKPKDIVSGDFYWAREKTFKGQKYWYLTAGDCTGHGVPGAFLTMLGTSFLNEIISDEELLEPAEILDKLRAKVIQDLGQTGEKHNSRDGMDMALVRVNLDTLEASYSGANNPLWIINKEGELKEIKADKQPVSYQEHSQPFTNHTIQLRRDDTFYIFSDGYADQFGGEDIPQGFEKYNLTKKSTKRIGGKKFKSANFKKLLTSIYNVPMAEQKEVIDDVFETWKGDLEQLDDVCVIGVKLKEE